MDGHIELARLQEWETGVSEAFPRIGKYELRGLLGKGGMGVVHRAFDPALDREVALKVMLPRIARDPEHKRRFEREGRAVARMSHPNVVTVFDLGYHTDGSPYIVMELLKGRDLLQILRSEPELSLEGKIAIVLQVLGGLAEAHRAGIVHRDIKPANVIVDEDAATKITDFGVAHFPAASSTASGIVVGTANYMSPEQVLGGRIDGRSDLWSVGCMLGEMLTGRPPFEAETAMATLYRVAHGEPRLPLPEGPQSERLRAILHRTLAKSPEARFSTAEELAAALRGLKAPADRPRAGLESSAPARGPAPAATAAAETRAADQPTPRRRADPAGICGLLREAHRARKSGQLHFSHASEHRGLRLLEGRIVHAASDVAGEHLGDVLVRFGHLGQADLERALTVVLGRRKRLGTVLAEMGLIGAPDLGAAVGEHVREILFSALERPDGSATFEELPETALDADLTCALTTREAILEATRRVHDPELIEGALGDMNRVVVAADDVASQPAVMLTPTDGFVLSRIDGTLSATEVLSLVPGPREDAARSLFGLLCTGLVDFKNPAPPTPRPRAAVASTPAPPVSTRAAVPPADTTGEKLREVILSAYEGLRYKDHFEILGVPRAASEADIREAYARLVRVVHPDACRDPSVADLARERTAIFARVCQAYETLRSPAARATYERDVAPLKRRPSLPAGAPAPFAPTSVEASAVTRNPAREAEAEAERTASDAVACAIRFVKREKYWDAIQLLEPAIPRLAGPARHRARVLLAQAYLKNPLWSKRAEAVLQSVLGDDPQHVDAHFLLAGLYLKTQLEARAIAMFRKVLELQPDHAGAAAGLKALQSPKEPSFRLPFLKRL